MSYRVVNLKRGLYKDLRKHNKTSRRECPGCNVVKVYEDRHKCCSVACSQSLRKNSSRTDQVSASHKTLDDFSANGDSATVTRMTPERVRTLAQLLSVCDVDTSEWEVDRWQCNKWEVGSKNSSQQIVVTELYQVKAFLKRKVAVINARKELDDLKAQAKETAYKYNVIKRGPSTGYTLEVSIPDLHVGKLAWGKETGWENYDVKEAEKVFEEGLDALIERTSAYKFDRVIFVVGNDLLHADNKQSTTTAGTPQDVDGRFQKNFVTARRLIVNAILRLRTIAPVLVPVVPGNHDTLSTWCLGDSLEMRFHDCPDVTIDNSPTLRKYVAFGSVMLMFTHGNRGKLSDYPLLMAAEQPKMFGNAVHREAHTGDKHHMKVEEYHGIRVRISPALCPPDAWHSEHHYVGSSRSAEAFVWHESEGLVGTAVYTVQPPAKSKQRKYA